MPTIRIPQSPQNWQISYGPDGTGDIVRTFQVNFTMQTGKVTAARRIQRHTAAQDDVDSPVPSSYVFTNADGTARWWKYWGELWKTAVATSPFVQDALTNSPSDDDGDLAVFGRTIDGDTDILYATDTQPANLVILNQDFDNDWIEDYWTGQGGTFTVFDSITSPTTTGEIRINLTTTSSIQTSDIVIIRNHSQASANGTWTVHNVSGGGGTFDLARSVFVANGSDGTANELYDESLDQPYLGQLDLDSSYPVILKRFTSAQQDLLFVGNGNQVHTISNLHSIDYLGQPFVIGTSTNTAPIVIATGPANGYSTGDIVRIQGHQGNTAANGTWTITVTAPAAFELNGSVGNGAAVVLTGTASQVNSTQASDVVYNRFVFLNDFECNWIQCTKDRVYIGFRNKLDPNLPSYVVEYDPLTETSNPVIANNGQTTGFIFENICHIVDIKGWISRFNANGFASIVAFPTAYTDGLRFIPVHRNGVCLLDDRPHFLMTGKTQVYAQILPAGVWCWEPASNRLYHKGGGAASNSELAYLGASTLGGSTSGTFDAHYGALFPLAPVTDTVAQDFFAGMVVNITNSGSDPIVGTFSTVVVSGGDSLQNRGWIVTSKIYSKDINAIFRNIVAQYSPSYYPFGRQSGALVVKYRTSDPIDNASTFDTGTWASSTTFTVSAAAVPNIAVGNEVFILDGAGAGWSTHITTITGAGTKTITIDETIPNSPTGQFAFVYENWTKLIDETYTDGQIDDNTLDHWQLDIPENESSWVQFKIEIRTAGTTPFRGMALEEFGVGYQENLHQEGGQRDRSN